MYGVTPEGYVAKPFAVIREDLESTLRTGDPALGIDGIDPLLDTSDQTPTGQVVAVVAGALAELWELGADVYASRYPDSAAASALDEVASMTGTERDPQTKTRVLGQVTLTASTTLPAGSVAHLTGRPSDRFLTLEEVVDGGGGGTYSVDFEAEDAGFLDVLPNQLTVIAELVSGWTAVDNALGATVVGTDAETDAELRAKRALQLALPGSTNVDAIRADLLDLDGVTDARVTEDLLAHTISATVRGGTAQAIWDALFAARAAGIETLGSSAGTVTDSQGVDHTERYTPAVAQAIHVDVTVQVAAASFDAVGGPTAIKEAIEAYIDGLGIAQDVVHDLTKCAAYDVPGVTRVTALLQGVGSPAAATDVTIGAGQYATADVANIAVTVT